MYLWRTETTSNNIFNDLPASLVLGELISNLYIFIVEIEGTKFRCFCQIGTKFRRKNSFQRLTKTEFESKHPFYATLLFLVVNVTKITHVYSNCHISYI